MYPMSIRWVSEFNSDILGSWRESSHVATMILAHRLDSLRLVRGKEGLYQCHQAGHRFNRFDIYRDSVELFPSVLGRLGNTTAVVSHSPVVCVLASLATTPADPIQRIQLSWGGSWVVSQLWVYSPTMPCTRAWSQLLQRLMAMYCSMILDDIQNHIPSGKLT